MSAESMKNFAEKQGKDKKQEQREKKKEEKAKVKVEKKEEKSKKKEEKRVKKLAKKERKKIRREVFIDKYIKPREKILILSSIALLSFTILIVMTFLSIDGELSVYQNWMNDFVWTDKVCELKPIQNGLYGNCLLL